MTAGRRPGGGTPPRRRALGTSSRSRAWGVAVGAALALAAAGSGLAAGSQEKATFPHARHEGLFPVCQGCHAGVESGAASATYPDPARCAACHDGEREPRVAWSGPTREPGHVAFSHPAHVRAAAAEGEEAPGCGACHRGGEERMAVVPATAAACLGCHAHEAPSHLAPGRDCARCHAPLARSPVGRDRIAAFPRPEGHRAEGFVLDHAPDGPDPSCAVCHARESCARCHLNGDALADVRALEPDARVAWVVAGRAPDYPEPPSHGDGAWEWRHGASAVGDDASCSSCHRRADCRACHVDASPEGSERLVAPPPGDPRGVGLDPRAVRVHDPGWLRAHPAGAAVAAEGCSGCHAPSFCADCHDGAEASFHLPNFLEMHGPEAYGSESECTACHSPEVFCRACHAGTGLASEGARDVAFHTARPLWLLGHGAAARQGLSGCVTCHSQSDCVACHSVFSGWGVNPHGPGFDAERARAANPWACAACHLGGVPP